MRPLTLGLIAASMLAAGCSTYDTGDGRYYCRRDDGTTGLIVGGIASGALGAAIAPGGSGLLGAVIGAAGGALAGQAIDRNDDRRGNRGGARCR